MSEPYDHIWLQFYGEDKSLGKAEEITWCEDQQHDCDVKYIRADLHEAQLRTARSDALEEAAKVADKLYCHMTSYPAGAAVPRHFHYEESVQDSIRAMIGAGK